MNSRGAGPEIGSEAKSLDQSGPKSQLRVGVIGAGIMGSMHARVLAGLPGVQLVGVVDPLPAHRTRVEGFAHCRTFDRPQQKDSANTPPLS